MKLIIGLGNPGPKYAGTRHNVGFEVIDYLAAAPGTTPFREKFEALIAEQKDGGETLLLVKPLTFMNLSGKAALAIADFYKVALADVLVICDDFNLPLGKLRLRAKGSHGGQNGLRNVKEQFGTDAYARLRIGVGAPNFGDAVDHVLTKFKAGERAAVDDAIAQSAQAVLLWARSGIEAAMNRFNADSNEKGKVKKEKGKDKEKSQAEKTNNEPKAASGD